MSSVALYGDLYRHLAGTEKVEIGHGLISIKVLPEQGFPVNEPEFYGLIIEESVQRCDVIDATAKKIICYAITHPAETATGRPSITSSYIDKLRSRFDGRHSAFVCARRRNIGEDILPAHYDDINVASPVEDPAQSWNARQRRRLYPIRRRLKLTVEAMRSLSLRLGRFLQGPEPHVLGSAVGPSSLMLSSRAVIFVTKIKRIPANGTKI